MSVEQSIRVEKLVKEYKLYGQPQDRLRESFSLSRKKFHHTHRAINNVSFEVNRGETVGIIGRNGSGKSTLLKMIAGVLTPTSGRIEVNGKVSALLELGSGFNPELSGVENVYFYGSLVGHSRQSMDTKIDEILSFADIGEYVHQPVRTYSSGMMVRLAFSVATAIEPEILIVDEALSVGDSAFQIRSKMRIQKLIDSGVSCLLVSHDLNTIKAMATRCLYLNGGEVRCFGDTNTTTSLYMSDLRDELNQTLTADHLSDLGGHEILTPQPSSTFSLNYHPTPELVNAVGTVHTGEKAVEIVGVQILNDREEPSNDFDHLDSMHLRLSVLAHQTQHFNMQFQVFDSNLRLLFGTSLFDRENRLCMLQAGEKAVIDFGTALNLGRGTYSVAVALTVPAQPHQLGYLIHGIQNVEQFTVRKHLEKPVWGVFRMEHTLALSSPEAEQ